MTPDPPGAADRPVALFLLAAVLFSPWLLRIADGGAALVLYLFGAWALVILLLALQARR